MTTFELCGAERVDDVRELWLQLHHHHQRVSAAQPLVDDDELSWQRRRALYLDRLRGGEDFLALAVEGASPVGYAMVTIEPGPDDTFPVGERYAEVYSLSVAEHARGHGIGTQLLDFVDRELAARHP
jgi:ribosomal protein S18 acetylase RimI-like enzyme